MAAFTFADLFAGIGGFHAALHSLGAECVFACEIDRHARETYTKNFSSVSPALFTGNGFPEDITKVEPESVPDFDLLCAGFPCQPFSQAGFKRGFAEERGKRGNMFFEIARLLEAKRPKAFFLENVRHLLNHDGGRTFRIIRDTLERQLGYSFYFKVVKASDHGLPQHRPRLFMAGFRDEQTTEDGFRFPDAEPLALTMSHIFGAPCQREIGYTLRVGGKGSGIGDRRNWDCYLVEGKERRLTPEEGKRMMGLPDDFVLPCSRTRSMEQLGNSVAVPAVRAVARQILAKLAESTSPAPPAASGARPGKPASDPRRETEGDAPLSARDPEVEGFAALLDIEFDSVFVSAKPVVTVPVKSSGFSAPTASPVTAREPASGCYAASQATDHSARIV